MSRRSRPFKRVISPDARFHSEVVQLFINRMMRSGKKSTATRVMYTTLDMVGDRAKREPIEVFDQALKNVAPQIEVKPRRVGGATYQVPVEVPQARGLALAMRWIIASAKARSGKSMTEKLAGELSDAIKGQGATIKKRDDTHRMAEANRAFAHYRW